MAETGKTAEDGRRGGPVRDVAAYPKPQGPAHQEQALALPEQSGEAHRRHGVYHTIAPSAFTRWGKVLRAHSTNALPIVI